MAVQGLRDVSGFTVTGQRPENWREGILLLFPNGDTPLTGLTSLMRSGSVDDPKFHHFEKVMSDQRLQINEDLDATETQIDVVSGALECAIGTLLYVEHSGEIIFVAADPSVDTALPTVIRGFGGTTGATVTIASENPYMRIIGTAFEEGSSAPTGIAYDPSEKYNYTQIFRNTLEATRTAINTRLRTGDAIREAKREALQYHSVGMEMAFWFGGRDSTTRNGRPLRTTEGFFKWLGREQSGRVVTAPSATVDLEYLEERLKDIFDYGSSEKMGFGGNRALLTIQQVIRKNSNCPYTIVQGQKEFGMNVSRLVCPFGEIVLKSHPLFSRMASSAGNYYSTDSWLAVMDMENVRYRYLKNSDTHYTTNLQTPGDDQTKAGYLSEAGLEWHHALSHYVIKNMAIAAAD
jgi:hypothetical protein